MKLFNLFKPHIIEFIDASFGVRELSMFGFEYYDESGVKHSRPFQVNTHCRFDFEYEAEELLDILKVEVL